MSLEFFFEEIKFVWDKINFGVKNERFWREVTSKISFESYFFVAYFFQN